jgi:hypothetical protein
VSRGLVPNCIWNWIFPIAQSRNRFGQCQRSPFRIREVRRISPRRDRKCPLVGLAAPLQPPPMHVDTHTASIDLARAKVNKFPQFLRQTTRFCQLADSLQRFHRSGDNHGWMIHSRLHHFSFSIGYVSFVNRMTNANEEM